MSDLVSLVLGIPGVVEGFVKTCRCIEAYKGVEKKHKETIADAIHYSRKLDYYAHFVDHTPRQQLNGPNEPTIKKGAVYNEQSTNEASTEHGGPTAILEDSQELLYDLFKKSLLSLDTAQKVVDEWTLRLGLNTGMRGHSRLFIAKFALKISDHLAQRDGNNGRRERKALFSDLRGKTVLLVIGCQQIEDAMGRLKHWLRELHDILMTSPVLRRRLSSMKPDLTECRSEPKDDVLFVSMAREREHSTQTMETIKPEWISVLRPLDNRKAHNFMLIDSKDSPYSDCLVDRRNVLHLLRSRKEEQALKDTERIARLFAEERDELGHEVSASVGVLPCCGFARPIPEYHDLVFRLPPGTRRPRTLRSLLLQGHPQHSLNDRLDFSIKLATAILIVHSLNLVHKDLRPDSVIVVETISPTSRALKSPQCLGEPFLVAFNESRSLDSATVPLSEAQYGERRWASLYRHPRHLTSPSHRPFEMRDDIYSLGICLLEVAIWSSLFIWDETRKIYINDTSVCDLSAERYDKMLEEMGEDTNRSQAWFRQMDLVQLAEEKVPVTMGDAFRDVVVECLTFGTGKQSMAEVLKGKELGPAYLKNQSVAFINNVLSKLRSLKLS